MQHHPEDRVLREQPDWAETFMRDGPLHRYRKSVARPNAMSMVAYYICHNATPDRRALLFEDQRCTYAEVARATALWEQA